LTVFRVKQEPVTRPWSVCCAGNARRCTQDGYTSWSSDDSSGEGHEGSFATSQMPRPNAESAAWWSGREVIALLTIATAAIYKIFLSRSCRRRHRSQRPHDEVPNFIHYAYVGSLPKGGARLKRDARTDEEVGTCGCCRYTRRQQQLRWPSEDTEHGHRHAHATEMPPPPWRPRPLHRSPPSR
jgi:hypothetical protein